MRLDYRKLNAKCSKDLMPEFFGDDGKPALLPYHQHIRITNLDTGKELTKCVLADDVTGQWERFVTGPDGRMLLFGTPPHGPRARSE